MSKMTFKLALVCAALTLSGCMMSAMQQPRLLEPGDLYVSADVSSPSSQSPTRMTAQAGLGLDGAEVGVMGSAGAPTRGSEWLAPSTRALGARLTLSSPRKSWGIWNVAPKVYGARKFSVDYLRERADFNDAWSAPRPTPEPVDRYTAHQLHVHHLWSNGIGEETRTTYFDLGALYTTRHLAHRQGAELRLHRVLLTFTYGVQRFIIPERLAFQLEGVARVPVFRNISPPGQGVGWDVAQLSGGLVVYLHPFRRERL